MNMKEKEFNPFSKRILSQGYTKLTLSTCKSFHRASRSLWAAAPWRSPWRTRWWHSYWLFLFAAIALYQNGWLQVIPISSPRSVTDRYKLAYMYYKPWLEGKGEGGLHNEEPGFQKVLLPKSALLVLITTLKTETSNIPINLIQFAHY